MRDSSSITTSDIPKNTSPISYDDNNIIKISSQIAPISLDNQINNAINNKNSNNKSYLGKVTTLVANKVQQLTGIDVANRKHVLTNNDIRHILNNHGNQNIEAKRGQIAVTPEDIKNIPSIISEPDDILNGSVNKQGKSIRYIKNYSDNTSVVVEVVPEKSKYLKIKTMWKENTALTHAPNNNSTLRYTSETESSSDSTLINDNITNSTENVNLPPVNNMNQNKVNIPIRQDIANNQNINYNTNEGDFNDQRGNIKSLAKDGQNERRGMGTIQGNDRISDIFQTNNERNDGNQKGITVEQGYGTNNSRRKYFERIKNNKPKIPTIEQIELQKEAKELGIDTQFFLGEQNSNLLGTTDKGSIYLDVNSNNATNEDSNLKQRFYHEFFHNIKNNENLNIKSEINELKQKIADKEVDTINKYIENRGYDSNLFSNSSKMKLRFAEEVLADYSAKHLAGYNIDYNLSQETEYRLNTLLDDAINTMKLNTKNNQHQIAPLPSNTLIVQDTQKVMNPIEISNLTKDNASTTPKLPITNKNNNNATSESSFYKNVIETSKFLNEDVRNILKNEDDIKYYKNITNKEILEKAYKKLQDGGANETLSWFNRNGYDETGKYKYKPTAEDVAEGWILMKQYQDNKDYDLAVNVAKKMREIGTNAGQTVQAFNIMERLTPEGMVKYAQSELSEAYDKMVKNKSKQWIEKHRQEFDLKPNEVQFIIDNMKEISKMEDGYEKRVKLAEIQKMMTDKLPPQKGAGIKSWMRISMLFNPSFSII